MWNWIKKTSRNSSSENNQSTTQKNIPTENNAAFDADELSRALDIVLDVMFRNNAKASLLYAKAAGYRSDVIDYQDIETFIRLIKIPFEDLDKESIATAAIWANKELLSLLRSSELRKKANVGPERALVNSLSTAINTVGAQSVERAIGRRFGNEVVDKAANLKQEDLIKILGKLEEKKDVLKPIFMGAISKGKNKYGEQDYTHLLSEISDFFDHFFPEGTLRFYFSVKPFEEIVSFALDWISSTLSIREMPRDGVAFEFWCAEHLERQGWRTNVTQASGDQGVDIEAWIGEFRVVVQCKRYSQPIGNKAVQEAYTGRQHRLANAAAIIGTGGFTRSAVELAKSTDVKLINAEHISEFSAAFGFQPQLDTQRLDEAPFNLSLEEGAELTLGRVFLIVAEKHLPFLEQSDSEREMPALSRLILDSIDATKGCGLLIITPSDLVSLLLFSEIVLVSLVELSGPDADYTAVEHEGDKTIYNKMTPVDEHGLSKLRSTSEPVQYYELLEEGDVFELRSLIMRLYNSLPTLQRKALESAQPYRPFTHPPTT